MSINGREVNDVLDYRFFLTDTNILLCLLRDGEPVEVSIQKKEYDDAVAQKKAEYEQNASKDDPAFRSTAYKINYQTDTFYIPKDASYAADVRYDKKGSGWLSVLAVAVLSVLIALFIIFILPDMLQMLDNFIGLLKPEANYH